ncbi:STE family protein kinase [Histomonas meleagridis]|uniref:STE family protein kinase n=1 Tax=Histomonas meleagridis TaxID=135588 RepID=UPI00355A19E7|nr:STE family protein kinase [Histomonas meleagridis]KAH0797871.1 STE family protein kinase [Histomonas meleagridis]
MHSHAAKRAEEEDKSEKQKNSVSVIPPLPNNSKHISEAINQLQKFCAAIDPNGRDALMKEIIQQILHAKYMNSLDHIKPNSNSSYISRYCTEFTEVETLSVKPSVKVVSALHKIDQCLYAIKQYRRPVQSLDPESLMSEAQLIINLVHPNIIRYYTSWIEFSIANNHNTIEFGTKNKKPTPNIDFIFYIQMELCQKENILEHCRKVGISFSEKLSLACRVAEGLAYLHSTGIVHNNLKPSSILIGVDGQPKITGFKKHKNVFRQHNCVYAPPELHKIDKKADVYALGVILFQLFGKFKSKEEEKEAIEKLRCQRTLHESFGVVPNEISQLILVMTEITDDKRPPADKVVETLSAVEQAENNK